MADGNVESNAGAGGAKFAVDNDGTQVWPYAKLAFGPGGTQTEVADSDTKRMPVKVGDPLPAGSAIIGKVIVDSIGVVHVIIDSTAAPLSVTGPLTDAQLAARLPLAVDPSGVISPVSATALPLPAGASTAARQDTQTTALGLIATEATLALIKAKTDNIPADPSREGGVLATAANQTTGNASLTTIASTVATAVNQATEITSLAAIDADLGTRESRPSAYSVLERLYTIGTKLDVLALKPPVVTPPLRYSTLLHR